MVELQSWNKIWTPAEACQWVANGKKTWKENTSKCYGQWVNSWNIDEPSGSTADNSDHTDYLYEIRGAWSHTAGIAAGLLPNGPSIALEKCLKARLHTSRKSVRCTGKEHSQERLGCYTVRDFPEKSLCCQPTVQFMPSTLCFRRWGRSHLGGWTTNERLTRKFAHINL